MPMQCVMLNTVYTKSVDDDTFIYFCFQNIMGYYEKSNIKFNHLFYLLFLYIYI